MNTPRSQPPRDDQIDALLARRYRDTSPEFEARWVALKRDLRSAPPARHLAWFHGWVRWTALGGAVAATVFTLSVWRKTAPTEVPGEVSPALAELFAMDAVLGRATVLLNAENRDALFHLPATAQPHS